MTTAWTFLLVGVGGAVGAAARFAVTTAMLTRFGPTFPYGVLLVNVLGSFFLGVVVAISADPAAPRWPLALLGVGFLGGFTTFSSFAIDVIALLERRDPGAAALYVGASVVLSVAAAGIGVAVGRALRG